jgi:hypothetical protein
MLFGLVRWGSRAGQTAQRAHVQHLAERAAELEIVAERFKAAGNEELAAYFAKEAASMREAGA